VATVGILFVHTQV